MSGGEPATGDPQVEQDPTGSKIAAGVMFAHIPASLFLWWLEFSSMPSYAANGLEGVGMMAILFGLAFASVVVAVIASGFSSGRRWAPGSALTFFGLAGAVCVVGFVNHLSWFGMGRGFVSPRLLVGYGIFSITCLGVAIYSLARILAHRTES